MSQPKSKSLIIEPFVNKELYVLRNKMHTDFDKISDFRIFLDRLLFGEQRIFPMVVGYKDVSEKGWEIWRMNPLTNPDKLTVENYLGGIRMLEQQKDCSRFNAWAQYLGIDHGSDLKCEPHPILLDAGISDTKDKQRYQLILQHNTKNIEPYNNIAGYFAKSQISSTRLEEVCERFVGPNRG